ncbi:MAG: GvpL/GvpF family gas vesicle protein [Myxococcales bacterium]|nr:GvpL/GvpF family gas vesicle protein [Myxococcales bacterium]
MGAFKRAVPKGKPKAGKRSKADPPVSRVKPAAAKPKARPTVEKPGRASAKTKSTAKAERRSPPAKAASASSPKTSPKTSTTRRAASASARAPGKRSGPDASPPPVQRLPPSAPEARDAISPVAVRALAPEPVSLEGTRGKYVYCVIHADKALNFGPLGIGVEPAEVHTVNFKDIAAVVSDTPIAVHEPTRANVLAHERVNETVMRDHTVIPMSFGTVFKTRDDIHELLRSAYDAFKDVLVKMEDKLEFGLKVLWDRDLIVKELETENEDIRRLKSEITSQKGSTYFARMQYGRLVDGALQARSELYVQEIFDALRPASVASRANRPIGDRMIMNAAFLVLRDKEGEFDRIVKQIGAKNSQLTFKYTGPWPPYNFVNIRLKLERA